MSVPAQEPITQHTGNGVTTSFAYQFLLTLVGDIQVSVNGVSRVINTDYTLTGLGSPAGGTITFNAAPPSGASILFVRAVALQRDTNYQYAGDFQAKTVNDDFDRLWMAKQDLYALTKRSIKLPPSDGPAQVVLPQALVRANKALVFDEFGAVSVSQDDYNDQAANAATQAQIATAQAQIAAAQAGDASASAASALDAQTAINHKYRGALGSDPATRTDGAPNQAGDEYFNTLLSRKKVFNGTGWYLPEDPLVAEAIDSIKAFNSRGAWVAFTAYAVKDLVLTGGTWYVCVAAHTSSAAFATDSAKWRVHQGVTGADLSAPGGAGLIGYGSSDVASVLNGLITGEVNIRDPRFAGGADKNGVTDATAAVQAALDQDLPIYAPAGRYKINGSLLTNSNTLRIRGDGDATVLDFSGGGALNVFSTVTSLPFMSASMIAGSNQVSFAAAHGLVEGDVFALHNPTDFSFAPFRNYYRDGCMFRVAAVPSVNTVITFGLAPDTYAFGAMNAYKINGGSVVVKDLKIIPPPTGIAMWIDAHQSVKLHDVTVPSGSNDTAIEVYRCFDVDVRGVKSDALLGDAYPIVFANTQKVTLSDSALYSTRHCLAIGGRDGPASVPPRDIRVNNCILENDGSLGIGASDIHGNAVDIVYNNCKMNSNANMAGKDVAYIDCEIGGRPVTYYPDGNCITGSEVVGGVFEIIGCKLTTYGNGSANGFVNLDVDKIRSDFMLVMRGNTIINKAAATTGSKCVTLFVGNSSPPAYRIDVVIDGLTYKASAGFSVLILSGANDISTKSSYIIDNFNGPAGMLFIGSSNEANYGAPMRLQRQSGRVTLSAASGQAEAIAANIPFRYPYPRPPSGQVSAVSDSGGALLAVGGMYALTATAIRPKISSTYTAWPSTNDVVACWTAGIAEI